MIYEVKMYSGKCDNCGTEIQLGGGEYSAYGEADLVQDEMADSDWHIEEMPKGEPNKHYCPDCFSIGDNDEVVIKESRKKGIKLPAPPATTPRQIPSGNCRRWKNRKSRT